MRPPAIRREDYKLIGEELYNSRWPEVCLANTMKLTSKRTDKIPGLTDEELDTFLVFKIFLYQ